MLSLMRLYSCCVFFMVRSRGRTICREMPGMATGIFGRSVYERRKPFPQISLARTGAFFSGRTQHFSFELGIRRTQQGAGDHDTSRIGLDAQQAAIEKGVYIGAQEQAVADVICQGSEVGRDMGGLQHVLYLAPGDGTAFGVSLEQGSTKCWLTTTNAYGAEHPLSLIGHAVGIEARIVGLFAFEWRSF